MMMTVTNKLATHLVLPNGFGDKQPLKLPPKGETKIENITADVKDAESKGLIFIGYPTAEKANEKPTAKAPKPKEE